MLWNFGGIFEYGVVFAELSPRCHWQRGVKNIALDVSIFLYEYIQRNEAILKNQEKAKNFESLKTLTCYRKWVQISVKQENQCQTCFNDSAESKIFSIILQ